ncbi:MAG: hypothetical protein RLZ15_570 [Actinomycetota bacterium]
MVFFNSLPIAKAVAVVSSSVAGVRAISSSGITATGLKKWKPTTRFGCCNPADIFSTEREEVLVASTHSGEMCFSNSLKRSFLSCNSSKTASIIKSHPA